MVRQSYSFLIVLFVSFLFSCTKNQGIDKTIIKQEDGTRVLFKEKRQTSNTLARNDASTNAVFDFLPTSTTNQIVKNAFYTLSYSESHEQSEWVAYELKKEYVRNNHFRRPFFYEDPKVTTGSADWKNYKNSGYDKGHLVPAGDMGFNLNAYNDTFLTSNISPQVHDFNNGIWNRLEQKVRYWAVKYNGVYVVTAGILDKSLKTIGKEKVAVPQYFYKVLLCKSEKDVKMIAFMIPNEASDRPLYEFVVAVDRLEKITGIDFFPALDDKIENKLESNDDYKSWSFK